MKKIVSACEFQMSKNEQVVREMQGFLRALESYPAQFALDPTITFDQHCSNLIPAAKAKSAAA